MSALEVGGFVDVQQRVEGEVNEGCARAPSSAKQRANADALVADSSEEAPRHHVRRRDDVAVAARDQRARTLAVSVERAGGSRPR